MARKASPQLEYLGPPPSADTSLAVLAEPVRRWFRQRFAEPTAVQRLVWPALAAGKNLLLAAPTGSGKSLAAFLPLLDRLLIEPPAAPVACLYVTPLKALGNDLQRNLRRCLRDLRAFLPDGAPVLRVGMRTGDTSARRRRLLRLRPPHVLLTTPESLAVLLSQSLAADLFADLRWVVIDEVHALAGNKRGADLALSLERVETLLRRGRLQRIGLSATCSPLEEVARFLAGNGRPCSIAAVPETAPLHLTVEPLEEGEGMGGFLGCLLDRLEPELTASRSTLVFTNTRALAERLSWALRRRFSAWDAQIAVHHSALAAARRRDVERRLKHGKLRAVISSTSLELGLDIGSVENVVLVHPPGGVVRLLQRVGRSGHAPGRPRRGRVLTTGPAELLEAAVTAASSYGGAVAPEYEPLQVPACPLDVLCQQLLGLAAQGWWSPDEAFVLAQRAYPYGDLSRVDFDDCLDYLSGRGRDGQDWLPTRLRWNEGCFTILDQRTARLLRRNLGTILAEEPRPVLARDSQRDEEPTPVGQLDERYADRLQPGDRFLLGGCCLEVRQCDAGAVYVEEVVGRPAVPRWGGEGLPLSAGLARRLYLLRTRAAEALRDGPAALVELLRGDYGLHERVAAVLAAYLQQQECVSEIPDAATCLVEAVPTEIGIDYYVHTPLNRAANDALTRIVALRLRRDRGLRCTSMVADLGFALVCLPAPELRPDDFRALLSAKNFDPDLDEALAGSVALRERFRRTALTGLMLLRNPLGGRRKVGGQDWPERRLFDRVVAADPDFVLLRQARRELRDEACDAPAALAYLEELPRRTVRCRWLAAPSPFVQGWTQLAAGPAETFESPAEVLERLHAQLTAE